MSQVQDISEYKTIKDQRVHVLSCPGMYVGSMKQNPFNDFVYNEGKLDYAKLTLPSGFTRLFTEMLCNALDNVGKSREKQVNPGIIECVVDDESIMVHNQGL